MRRRWAVPAVATFVLLVGTVAVVGLTPLGGKVPGRGADGHADVLLGGSSFRIAGDAVRPLSPGRAAAIDVRFTNPRGSRLRVTVLRVRVRAVRAPNADRSHPCGRRDFSVRQARLGPRVVVPARSSRSLGDLGLRRWRWPHVRMINRPVNQDGCKGATLTLSYRGTGRLRR